MCVCVCMLASMGIREGVIEMQRVHVYTHATCTETNLFFSLSLSSQTTYSESKGGVGLPGLIIAIVLCEVHLVSSSNCDIS